MTLKKEQKEIFLDIIINMVGIDPKHIKEISKFTNDLGFDSLDVIDLIMRTEEAFDISITEEEVEGIITVRNAMSVLDKILRRV